MEYRNDNLLVFALKALLLLVATTLIIAAGVGLALLVLGVK